MYELDQALIIMHESVEKIEEDLDRLRFLVREIRRQLDKLPELVKK